MMETGGGLPSLEAEPLSRIVAQVIDQPAGPGGSETSPGIDLRWSVERLNGGIGEALGVFRVAGDSVGPAVDSDAEGSTSWSVILKILGEPAEPADPSDWNYWLREPLFYKSQLEQSGGLELPPGFSMPRCFAVEEETSGQVWVWLEDLRSQQRQWDLDDFRHVAFGLGQFQAPFLTGRPLPTASWVSQDWLRQKVEICAPAIELLTSADCTPMVQRAFPPDAVEWTQRIWTDRERYLQILDRLPRTLCHMDAFPRNILFRRQLSSTAAPDPTANLQVSSGQADRVLIDWAYAGDGAIGQDLMTLVQGSLLFLEVAPDLAEEVEQVALAGYLAGLREGGWSGDPRLVELGYAAAGTVRFPLGAMDNSMLLLNNEELHPAMEQLFQRPIEEVADIQRFLYRDHIRPLAATAERLAGELGI